MRLSNLTGTEEELPPNDGQTEDVDQTMGTGQYVELDLKLQNQDQFVSGDEETESAEDHIPEDIATESSHSNQVNAEANKRVQANLRRKLQERKEA